MDNVIPLPEPPDRRTPEDRGGAWALIIGLLLIVFWAALAAVLLLLL